MRNFDIGVIISIIVSITGFAYWCGVLQTKVDELQSRRIIEQQKDKAIEQIQGEAKAAIDKIKVNQYGFIEPFTTVIGTAGVVGVSYIAPNENNQDYNIDVKIPQGSRLLAAWYVPVDNVSEIGFFSHIEVSVAGQDKILLKIGGKKGINGSLRINIYGVYGP